jgi:membrane protein DedA with SNARE-associated domain
MQRMRFRQYLIYSYTIGFFWTLLFFFLGRFFGTHIETLSYWVHHYTLYILYIFLLILACVVFIRRKKTKRAENKKIDGE